MVTVLKKNQNNLKGDDNEKLLHQLCVLSSSSTKYCTFSLSVFLNNKKCAKGESCTHENINSCLKKEKKESIKHTYDILVPNIAKVVDPVKFQCTKKGPMYVGGCVFRWEGRLYEVLLKSF